MTRGHPEKRYRQQHSLTGVNSQLLGPFDHLRYPVACLADPDHGRQRHAALTRRAERRTDQRRQRRLLVGVRQYHTVILGRLRSHPHTHTQVHS